MKRGLRVPSDEQANKLSASAHCRGSEEQGVDVDEGGAGGIHAARDVHRRGRADQEGGGYEHENENDRRRDARDADADDTRVVEARDVGGRREEGGGGGGGLMEEEPKTRRKEEGGRTWRRRTEGGLRRGRTRRKEDEVVAWAEAEAARGRAWRVAHDGRRTTKQVCWTTARTEERLETWELLGRAGHHRRRGEGKQGGGLEMAYSAARHGHDTQRADDTDTRRKRDKGGQNQCP